MKATLQYIILWLVITLGMGLFLAFAGVEEKAPTLTHVSNAPVSYNCHMHASRKGKEFVPFLKVVFKTTYANKEVKTKTLAMFDLYIFKHEKAERKGLRLCQEERKRQEKEKDEWYKKGK